MKERLGASLERLGTSSWSKNKYLQFTHFSAVHVTKNVISGSVEKKVLDTTTIEKI
jgi:hypothetical protein